MQMSRFAVLAVSCLMLRISTQAQQYPQGYFRNPLSMPIMLAGNFGECRPGHFHSGLDIKTGGKENAAVYAAADGYVSRIAQSPGGFGHAIYIDHPNGYTTLYAHLNDYFPALQQYLRKEQYARKSWTVDIKFDAGQWPVKKGQQIAWSGNTGGSTAPHLHFEIRDTKSERPINPQLFGFAIKDTRPALPTKLLLYNRANDFYQSNPKAITLKGSGNSFVTVPEVIEGAPGLAGIGLAVNDFVDGSTNTLNFYTADWYLDEALQGRIRLREIGYDESRYVHAYADYGIYHKSSEWVQCLFRLKGNRLQSVYENLNNNDGALALNDEKVHALKIVLTDNSGNKTTIHTKLQATPGNTGKPSGVTQPLTLRHESGNFSLTCSDDCLYEYAPAAIYAHGEPMALSQRFATELEDVPAHTYFKVAIRPRQLLPFALHTKTAMIVYDGKKKSGTAAVPVTAGFYEASLRTFGDYWLVADTVAPVITQVSKSAAGSELRFKIKDETTSVKTFEALLDGQWILLEQHYDEFFYRFDARCGKGKHRLQLKAADENGNGRTFTYNFTR